MIVLSVEGPNHMDRGLYSTHKILGVFDTEEQMMSSPLFADIDPSNEICLVTDMATGIVKRLGD